VKVVKVAKEPKVVKSKKTVAKQEIASEESDVDIKTKVVPLSTDCKKYGMLMV